MLGHLSADIICSEKRTVFRERAIKAKIKGVFSMQNILFCVEAYCATKMIPTCSLMTGQFYYAMIEQSTEPSKSTSWKMLETVLSNLN